MCDYSKPVMWFEKSSKGIEKVKNRVLLKFSVLSIPYCPDLSCSDVDQYGLRQNLPLKIEAFQHH